eukprot:2738481-Pleurochrysis_carterae.AAC.1
MVCMCHGRSKTFRELNRFSISLAIRKSDSVARCLDTGYFVIVSLCVATRYPWLSHAIITGSIWDHEDMHLRIDGRRT